MSESAMESSDQLAIKAVDAFLMLTLGCTVQTAPKTSKSAMYSRAGPI